MSNVTQYLVPNLPEVLVPGWMFMFVYFAYKVIRPLSRRAAECIDERVAQAIDVIADRIWHTTDVVVRSVGRTLRYLLWPVVTRTEQRSYVRWSLGFMIDRLKRRGIDTSLLDDMHDNPDTRVDITLPSVLSTTATTVVGGFNEHAKHDPTYRLGWSLVIMAGCSTFAGVAGVMVGLNFTDLLFALLGAGLGITGFGLIDPARGPRTVRAGIMITALALVGLLGTYSHTDMGLASTIVTLAVKSASALTLAAGAAIWTRNIRRGLWFLRAAAVVWAIVSLMVVIYQAHYALQTLALFALPAINSTRRSASSGHSLYKRLDKIIEEIRELLKKPAR